MKFLLWMVLVFFGMEAWSQAQSFRWPVSDSISRVNYGMDHDGAAEKVLDYQCGTKTYDGHRGTDIGAPRNTPVYAAKKGWVQSRADGYGDGFLGSQDGNGFGNHVVLFHDPDYNTIYGHFTSGTGIPLKNDTIECGERIGASGTSGNSSGPHMHFEIRLKVNKNNYYSGAPVDPFSGACSTPVSYWTQLNSKGVPVTQCAEPVVQLDPAAGMSWAARKSIWVTDPPTLGFVVPGVQGGSHKRVRLELFTSEGAWLTTALDGVFPTGEHRVPLVGLAKEHQVLMGRIWMDNRFVEAVTFIRPK
jgi:Peptidase family M23